MKSGLKSLALLLLVASAWAQMMPHVEYQSFLKKLDADTARWQKQLSAFHVEDLPVSYVEGKFVKASQDDASKNLDSIHEAIGQELVRPSLSTEIKIADDLESARLELTSLVGWAFRLAPQAFERWREEAAGNTGELMLYRVSMTKHVTAYADELQKKAEARDGTVFSTSIALGDIHVDASVNGGETLSTISISAPSDASTKRFFVQGKLQDFQFYGKELLLEFSDHLTAHTVVFSEESGGVGKVFEHTSNMGCFLAQLTIVCLSGTLAGPDKAEVFGATSQPSRAYELKAAVPYGSLYSALARLDNPTR